MNHWSSSSAFRFNGRRIGPFSLHIYRTVRGLSEDKSRFLNTFKTVGSVQQM